MGHILVTGAASGIGQAVTRQLLDQGHDVTAWDRADIDDPRLASRTVDLTAPDQIDAAAGELGSDVTALVNVAGVPGTADPRTVLWVNLWGTRAVTRAVAPLIGDGGAIVTVASVAAARCDWSAAAIDDVLASASPEELLERHDLDGSGAYDVSKKAILRWSALTAAQLIPRGIRSNTVSPGPTDTPILRDFRDSMGGSVERAESALGRHGRPDEIAAAAVFLASDAASWINATDLVVDGGLLGLASLRTETSA